mmetsp:Transcript_3510/g.5198  ORF Transcript_3510/g.5198 Transcript_3510/m.5198 type:complete len:180 (-) Transcript_3510:233-772(-)|eukprot:CAMPEP_0113944876 /NCGR_PEP_ID=MMETSP1339-20121228/37484_1 /TAXON_ID=94617 /ORGANISM="Fibrocapsa japonica" /LENGTH=179 /DNA_ID=CAMNT_0000950217 /DNA_START=98 /DNA_END=637 /DNA_ORIENTATION=+ /assembly_acc=CAM_ASM_000762
MQAAAAAPAPAPQQSQEITDITHLLSQRECFCLNQDSKHPIGNLFMGDERLFLKSEDDEQLLLHFAFNETVKIHSINFVAPDDDSAPETVKLFVNVPSMGFSDAEDNAPTQVLELQSEDLDPTNATLLRYVKFQAVTTLSVFVETNRGADQTVLSSMKFNGLPIDGFNVAEIKKQEPGA